jgi:hypothetical protein
VVPRRVTLPGRPVSKTTVASQNRVGQLHPNTARVSFLYRMVLACPLPTDSTHSTHNTQHSAYRPQRTAHTQHTIHSTQHTALSTPPAAHSTHRTHNTQHSTCCPQHTAHTQHTQYRYTQIHTHTHALTHTLTGPPHTAVRDNGIKMLYGLVGALCPLGKGIVNPWGNFSKAC